MKLKQKQQKRRKTTFIIKKKEEKNSARSRQLARPTPAGAAPFSPPAGRTPPPGPGPANSNPKRIEGVDGISLGLCCLGGVDGWGGGGGTRYSQTLLVSL